MNHDELIAQLAEQATPVRRAPHPFMLFTVWLACAGIYIAAAISWFGVRSDLVTMLHTPLYLGEIALLATIIISCALSSALLGYPDLYQKPRLLLSPVIVFILLVGVMVLSWQGNPDATAPDHGLSCTLHITLMSLLPAVVLFYGIGKLACTHSAKAGICALLTSFSIGALIARLGEQTDSITHIAIWHYLPMLGVALVGTLLGRILLRW
jgi:hypothetical protein